MTLAYKKLDIKTLSTDLIKKFYNIKNDLEILDSHLLIANNDNHEQLVELNKKILKIKNNEPKMILYRGSSNSFQDSLGFDKKDLNKTKRILLTRDVSFSLDIEIARGFGYNILKTQTSSKTDLLFMHDELMYIIQKEFRNIKEENMQTQKEVIIFKDNYLNIELIETSKRPNWLDW